VNGKEVIFQSSSKTAGRSGLQFRIESQAGRNGTRIVITRVELNSPIDDARFAAEAAAKPQGSAALTSPGDCRTVAAGIS
jgi:hypothetical protein